MAIKAKVIHLSVGEARRMFNMHQLADGYATLDEMADASLTLYKIGTTPGYRIKRKELA